MYIHFSILVVTLAVVFNEVAAQVRKCLDDKDCYSDECCAQAFYLFRCEKRGFNEGDNCGLCGCKNGLTCSSEEKTDFRILSGRGVCRYKPNTFSQTRPPMIPKPRPEIRPEPRPEESRPSWSKKPMKVKPGDNTPNRKPGKDHFYETFQPIYQQFVELAVSVAGITLDDTTETIPANES